MIEVKMVKCDSCDKEVSAGDLDGWGDCTACMSKSRDTGMTVGDLNTK